MSTKNLAANIVVPHGGDVCVFTTSTTDVITTLSATALLGTLVTRGQYITLCADGGDVYCFFKSTGADAAAPGTISGAASATKDTAGWLLKDGVPQHFRITNAPPTASNAGTPRTRLHHVCTAAAKKIRAYVSSYPTTDGIAR